MNAKEKILEVLKNSSTPLSVSDLVQTYQLGERTYLSHLLSDLVFEQKVKKIRNGRHILYTPSNYCLALEKNLSLKNLHEDEVWKEARENADFKALLSERTENILYFAFTEMLNNAIDHSKSGVGYAKIWQENDSFKFLVEDKGIGIFRNFMSKKRLESEIVAIGELIKGKQTTSPRWHSGEGIFWTSKIADIFIITSYDYQLILDNELGDYTIKKLEKSESFLGTQIFFSIKQDTKKSLEKLFKTYALNHSTFSFDTTSIPVKLFESGDIWISRSQAKRILENLDKYQKIIFDFKGIKVIGQGFADEIFRVFRNEHPNIILEPINMSESVKILVSRALNDPTGE